MEKVAEAVFIEPALFGFKKEEKYLIPFGERLPEDRQAQEQRLAQLQLQVTKGIIKTVSYSGGYVRLDPPSRVPGGVDRIVDSKGFGIFKFHRETSMIFFTKGDRVNIYKVLNSTGRPVFVIDK